MRGSNGQRGFRSRLSRVQQKALGCEAAAQTKRFSLATEHGTCPDEKRGEKWDDGARVTVPKTASGVLGEKPLADGTKCVREFGKIDL